MKKAIRLLLLALWPWFAEAEQVDNKVRIGVLAFGTVNWELAAIRNEGLDKKYGVALEVQTLGKPRSR